MQAGLHGLVVHQHQVFEHEHRWRIVGAPAPHPAQRARENIGVVVEAVVGEIDVG